MITFLWLPLTCLGKHFISVSFYTRFPSSERWRAFISRRKMPKASLENAHHFLHNASRVCKQQKVNGKMWSWRWINVSEEKSWGSEWFMSRRMNDILKLILGSDANTKIFRLVTSSLKINFLLFTSPQAREKKLKTAPSRF